MISGRFLNIIINTHMKISPTIDFTELSPLCVEIAIFHEKSFKFPWPWPGCGTSQSPVGIIFRNNAL